jgi:hypothetical protein
MNLGIPSAGYDDAVIRSRFLEVGRAAWMASLVRDVSLGTVRQAIESVRVGPLVSTSTVAVVPEVAAEMVGYARSKFRRPGLHAVVDIGASTLDICGISLFTKDGDDTYELLTADVTDMGFLELHSRRMFAANWRPPFNQVPADIVAPLAAIDACDHELRNRIEQSDEKYVDAAAAIVLRTLAWLHKRRAPVANAWSDGLPLFVTGGGADTPIARRIITRADKRAKDIWINYRGLVAQPLPMNIVDPAGNGARGLSRMAVAYGLSFPEINIGNIVPPGEIPDAQIDPPRRKDWQRAFIDKDAV